jgi:hypothetical protein
LSLGNIPEQFQKMQLENIRTELAKPLGCSDLSANIDLLLKHTQTILKMPVENIKTELDKLAWVALTSRPT